VLSVAAQLTGLKQLVLQGLSQLQDTALLQLTALTALEELELSSWGNTRAGLHCIHNKVPYRTASCLVGTTD
jgi:hypothetical protein